MTSPRRNRDRKPSRRQPFRDPKPTILIVCEGSVSEPEYFDGFWHACHNTRVTVHVSDDHGVPLTLVRIAKELKNEALAQAKRQGDDFLAFDAVWCVHDVDDHPQLDEAREMAEANNIELAISNPNFELWLLLLHFRDSPGMQHRAAIGKTLKQHVPDFEKHVIFSKYSAGSEEAVERARRLDQIAEGRGEAGSNPTTGVYKLTSLIRGNGWGGVAPPTQELFTRSWRER